MSNPITLPSTEIDIINITKNTKGFKIRIKPINNTENIVQKGSNITPERLRFDFTFGRKMTDEEKKKVEDLVNQKISEKLPVQKVVMKLS